MERQSRLGPRWSAIDGDAVVPSIFKLITLPTFVFRPDTSPVIFQTRRISAKADQNQSDKARKDRSAVCATKRGGAGGLPGGSRRESRAEDGESARGSGVIELMAVPSEGDQAGSAGSIRRV